MFRFAPSNLARTLIHGSRLATINRQQCRFIEDISYSKDFKPTKLATEDEQIEDEQTRRMRAAAENVFSANGVIITAYSEVSMTRSRCPGSMFSTFRSFAVWFSVE